MLSLVELLEYEKANWERIKKLEGRLKNAEFTDTEKLKRDFDKLSNDHKALEGVLMLVGTSCVNASAAIVGLQAILTREGSEGMLWLKLNDVIDELNTIPDLIMQEADKGGDGA